MARAIKIPGQQSLFGPDATDACFKLDDVRPRGEQKLLGYTLLLAIFPQEDEAQRFHGCAAALRSAHGLTGQQLQPGRLHMTLIKIKIKSYAPGDQIPQAHVDTATAAASRVKLPSFPVVFDRVVSCPESHAFVMACDELSNRRVATLRQTLATELKRCSGSGRQQTHTPHMTLLYDRHRHVKEQVIAPMRWTATRFALILSHAGLTHHQWIHEWRLGT